LLLVFSTYPIAFSKTPFVTIPWPLDDATIS
jgi:hypothetical protein